MLLVQEEGTHLGCRNRRTTNISLVSILTVASCILAGFALREDKTLTKIYKFLKEHVPAILDGASGAIHASATRTKMVVHQVRSFRDWRRARML